MVCLADQRHERALLMLETIAKHRGLTLSEISEKTGIPISKCSLYGKEFHRKRWVNITADGKKKRFFLSGKGENGLISIFFILTNNTPQKTDFVKW